MNSLQKRLLIISIFVLLLVILVIFLKRISPSQNKNVLPTPLPSQIILPTNIIPTTASSSSQTGVDISGTQEYFKQHPDLVIEADLRVSVPIKGDGFTVDFSYQKDKFQVYIKQPYSTNYAHFQTWFKSKGLKDLSQFEIIYQ
jgi:hypothetical protein